MIKKQEVQHIAKLARLGLTEVEIKKFQKELSSILDYFATLKEVDVLGIEPTFHPAEHSFGRTQDGEFTEPFFKEKLGIMREDEAKAQPVEVVKTLIEAAPEKKDNYLKVKAVF